MVVHMGTWDNLAAAVASQLRAERAAAQMTYKELADAAGMTEQSVMRYLTGKRDIPLPEFAKMAEALGLTPYELMKRAESRIHQV